MPRIPKSRIELLQAWVEPYRPAIEIISESVIHCNKCYKVMKCLQKQHLVQHISSQNHINANKDRFNDELCEAFLAANIPLKKLENPVLKAFLEKHTSRKIPDESTLRKYSINNIYKKVKGEIKNNLQNKYIWLSVDDTTDDRGRHVVNVIVGALEQSGPTEPFLIATRFFNEVNANIITVVVSENVNSILSDLPTQQQKVLLLITGAAAYMLEASQQLKHIYPNMLHVTCLAHALHRICEFIKDHFVDVDFFVSRMKKLFLNAQSRVAHYRKLCPTLPFPPQPVITRQGAWLEAVIFYADNFHPIQQTVLTLKEDTQSVQGCKSIVSSEALFPQLRFIKEHFKILKTSIIVLEKRGISLSTAITQVTQTISQLKAIPGDFGPCLSEKIDTVLRENPDLQILIDIATGNYNCNTLSPADLVPFYTYAPVTSCDVERAFSAYKDVLAKKRHQFTDENMEKVLSVYVNRSLFKI